MNYVPFNKTKPSNSAAFTLDWKPDLSGDGDTDDDGDNI